MKWARDPRNLTWLNDDSRYSVKLMKKMGWEAGKVCCSKLSSIY